MQNREIYEQDPKEFQLLNNGVAKVRDARSEEELETLRFELKTFICEGQYEEGLVRLLRAYLDNLDQPEQPAAWISGFFGSGKSHLIKILRYLWIDYEFPDGATARGLVNLSTRVEELLVELSRQAQRLNGTHAVSGTLGSGAKDSVRLALLGLVFKSAGLPEQYSLARFVIWLKENGLYEELRRRVEEVEGKDWDREVRNLLVSDPIPKHLLDLNPSLGNNVADVRSLLRGSYPKQGSVTLDEMVDAIDNALAENGELPCTLVALDEIQQYIGNDSQKTYDVQEVVEKCCSEFGGRLMFVGTGQTALSAGTGQTARAGTPELEKLTGRFNIQVQLSDADVQAVTRKTVLKKKASKRPDVRDTLTENSGEISRHLSGTEFEEKPEDEEHLIDDYPILPTRRRFWERVLRAVDEAGTKSQLRTQLKLVDEAVKQTAEDSLGTVVPGDFIYDDLRSELLQSGVLAGDIDTRIESLRSEEDDELGARLCALAFLIGKLPREEGADTGLRATPEVFADLLVTDLEAGSGTLRNRVEERLDRLVEKGKLMQVEGEYRMQTRESQEWMNKFREEYQRITKKRNQLATHRSDALREAANNALDDVRKIKHGQSNERRDITVHFSKNMPTPSGESIPVWVRDQWRDTLSSVEADAREAGHESPMVYVFLPKRSADQLDDAIATERAAKATIEQKGHKTTRKGEEARQAMITRREQATKRKESALEEILDGARVYLAGGKEYVGDDVAGAVENAALSALERLYPKFETADDSRWGKVLRDATGGSADALKRVDFQDNPEDHPVCEAVLEAVSTSTSGQEVRKEFTSAPHGWPQDAVDAALALLTLTNHVRAKHDGEVVDATDLTQRTIGKARFRAETVTLSKRQELEVLNVLQSMTNVKSGQELEKVPEFLERVRSLADRISGAAPLPEPPNMDPVDEVARLSGNERLEKLHDHKEWFHEKTGEWQSMANRKDRRETEWSQLQTALRQGQDLGGMEDVREEAGAVRRQRSLLQETNPVESPLDRATELLREELQAVHKEYESAYKEQLQTLRDSDPWQEIGEETRASILRRHDLGGVPEIEVGTTEALLDTLSSTPLDSWRTLVDALSQRFDKALSDAIRELEPDTTRADLESRVLKSEEDVEEWLEEARETLLGHLENGPVQV